MTALREVVRASTRAVVGMAVLLFGVAAIAGLAAGDLQTPLWAAAWGTAIGVTGLWTHETAHLVVARRLAGAHAAAPVGSGATVAVRAPGLRAEHAVWVAVLGPVAGAGLSLAWLAVGAPAWIAWAFAFVHAVNLLPVGGMDGALAWRAVCRLLTRRWAAQRGVTGGQ